VFRCAFFSIAIALVLGCGPVHKIASAPIDSPSKTVGGGGNGAPAGSGTIVSEPDTLEATFSSLEKNIFAPKCVQCHGAKLARSRVRMDSYDEVLLKVVPGSRKLSDIFFEVQSGEMPPIPEPMLTPEEIEVVGQWIDAGALDN
jgi:uncharacterized membrane protein